MTGNKKMGIGLILNTTGAILAYEIGAGFASGQEIMQFFSNWGSVGGIFEIAIIFTVFLSLAYIGISYIGRTREAKDIKEVYNIIGGKYLGRLLSFFVWGYNLGCYFFMISGFGNVLHQQFGMSIPLGSAIAVVVSAGTALLGLKKMVEIIGKIGPVIVVISLALGIASAFWTYPHINEGIELMQNGTVEVTRAGHSIFLSALSYTGVCLLIPMAYVASLGHAFKEYRFSDTKLIIVSGIVSYIICCVVLALNYIGNIAECAKSAIPNLVLANYFFSGVGVVFSIIVLLSVYSTMCPILWTCASMIWSNDNSLPYKAFIVVCSVVVYLITLYIPYEVLLNKIMTYFGYTGAFSGFIIVYRYIVLKIQAERMRPITSPHNHFYPKENPPCLL